MTERGVSICRFGAEARLVDVGCGSGATVAFLREKHRFDAIGIDVSSALLGERGQCNSSIPFIRGRAEALPFRGELFDGILCECVLSLLAEPDLVIGEFSRVLRPGGYMILSDLYDRRPKNGAFPNDLSVSGCLAGMRVRSVTERAIAAAGLELLLWEDHTHHLKVMAAQMILSQGSLGEFYDLSAPCGFAKTNQPAVMKSGAGYYLLVGRKNR